MRKMLIVLSILWLSTAALAAPITYQGQLRDGSGPYDGTANMAFRLYNSPTGGSMVGSLVSLSNVQVNNGLFQVELDFGGGAFDGSQRWLQVTVDGTVLHPRQPVTAAPMAHFALEAPPGDSLWNQSGDNISYTAGYVGIGAMNSNFPLMVQGTDQDGSSALVVHRMSENDFNSVLNLVAHPRTGGTATGNRNLMRFNHSAAGVANIGTIVTGTDPAVLADFTILLRRPEPPHSSAERLRVRSDGAVIVNSGPLVVGGNTLIGGWSQDDRLGVGTDNPWNTLHVVANEGQGPFRFAQHTADNIVLRGHSNRGVSVGAAYSTAQVPSSGLRVSGQVRIDSFGSTTANTVCRTPDGTIANCTSSERYKRDIKPLGLAVGRLKELQPVQYRWRDRDEGDIGLIAEEVAELFPELVYHNEEGQIEGIVQSRLMAVVIAAYQQFEQQTLQSIAHLTEENAELRDRHDRQLAELWSENAKLREQIAANSQLAKRNAELEERLARLEAVLIDGNRLAEN